MLGGEKIDAVAAAEFARAAAASFAEVAPPRGHGGHGKHHGHGNHSGGEEAGAPEAGRGWKAGGVLGGAGGVPVALAPVASFVGGVAAQEVTPGGLAR